MKLFNTLTMEKEDFIPQEPGKVGIYSCGPTVYNFIHIGNARPVIMFDVLRRYFEYRGYKVTFIQNFTDVDDKIIARAQSEGVSPFKTAEKYTAEYFTDARALGVKDASAHPKATENIKEIIEMTDTLIKKGFAYEAGGDVYFRTSACADYGKLSRQPAEELKAGARVDVTEQKENPADFALWKASKPNEPFWDSPWSKGRPGWHIECSAMATKYLGKTIDIHCGGMDLRFPHHENEKAQSECANGCLFVKYWLHNGFINTDERKMSKSLGNFFTVREAAEAYGYNAIRMFILMGHYRSPLNYSAEILAQAEAALDRLGTAKANLEFFIKNGSGQGKAPDEAELIEKLSGYRERFIEAMDDDFNTADAISVIFELVREINTAVAPSKDPSRSLAEACLKILTELSLVLGIPYPETSNQADDELDPETAALVEARSKARAEKNFKEADRIRDELAALGFVPEDTPQGVKLKRL
ncbi:MAG: cysteine--tRNA ligase [Oscillospiraceae bacterium]|nr:cysteine--tRNA ligase [Oscillospiraceae bacterium]